MNQLSEITAIERTVTDTKSKEQFKSLSIAQAINAPEEITTALINMITDAENEYEGIIKERKEQAEYFRTLRERWTEV